MQNPSKLNLKQGSYFPRATLSRRMNLQGRSEIMLTIEVSLPKLIFGNNVQELRACDFDQIVRILHEKLLSVDIAVTIENLSQAAILSVHFSKNIALTDGSTPFHFIQKIKQISTSSRMDNNQTDYRNAGHCFKFHCNSYEVVFYDKIYDMQRAQISKKRAIDPDSFFDLKVLSKIRTARKKFELLRMEVRLNKRSVIKKLFAALSVHNDLSLAKIFKPSLSCKVLLYYLNQIESKQYRFIQFRSNSDITLLSSLLMHNPQMKPQDILSCIGYKKLLEVMSADEIKKLLTKNHKNAFNHMMQKFETVMLPESEGSFAVIRNQLKKYKAMRLKNLKLKE